MPQREAHSRTTHSTWECGASDRLQRIFVKEIFSDEHRQCCAIGYLSIGRTHHYWINGIRDASWEAFELRAAGSGALDIRSGFLTGKKSHHVKGI
jgi:hypothetical protein